MINKVIAYHEEHMLRCVRYSASKDEKIQETLQDEIDILRFTLRMLNKKKSQGMPPVK